MSDPSAPQEARIESGRRTGGRSKLLDQVKLALTLWKVWAVGVLFLLIAWMAYGMDGLTPVVEPFYLFFALLAFGYGVRRLREKIEQSYL